METFAEYYNAAKKEFKYTIKLASNAPSEDTIGKIEATLQKYNLKSMSAVKKTPIQLEPIDFPNIRSSEVHIVDVVLEYPVTPDALLRKVAEAAEVSEQAVAVYAENDARHQYVDEWNERMTNNDEFRDNYKTKLDNPEDWEPEPDYGEKYNTSFLKTLKKVQDDSTISGYVDGTGGTTDDVTVTGDETSNINNDAVLKDRWRDAGENTPKKGKNTMMSKPSKESK